MSDCVKLLAEFVDQTKNHIFVSSYFKTILEYSYISKRPQYLDLLKKLIKAGSQDNSQIFSRNNHNIVAKQILENSEICLELKSYFNRQFSNSSILQFQTKPRRESIFLSTIISKPQKISPETTQHNNRRQRPSLSTPSNNNSNRTSLVFPVGFDIFSNSAAPENKFLNVKSKIDIEDEETQFYFAELMELLVLCYQGETVLQTDAPSFVKQF
ncbi:hypothetical protein HK096_010940 [Nowakowskiella sp. JEL0078]|nr:hypothetical protein HK096_010940 [Nowakowskiella sp. JEL0078]